jgi:hypothetical protein
VAQKCHEENYRLLLAVSRSGKNESSLRKTSGMSRDPPHSTTPQAAHSSWKTYDSVALSMASELLRLGASPAHNYFLPRLPDGSVPNSGQIKVSV